LSAAADCHLVALRPGKVQIGKKESLEFHFIREAIVAWLVGCRQKAD
jgi:hypothetical protein